MSLIDTWFDVYARARLGRSIRSAFAFDLFFKILAGALLAPVAALVLGRLILTGGGLSITNEAIAGFVLSPPGLFAVLLALAFALLTFYAEIAGIMHIASAASRGRPAGWADALATTVAALPRLLHLALWQAGILLGWLVPLAAAGATYLLLLGAHDINWYLANRPPAFIAALIIGALLLAAAAAVLLWYLVDWALSIPVCLYEDRRGRDALRRSRELVVGQRGRTLLLLSLNLSLALLTSAAALWLVGALLEVMLSAIDGTRALVIATAVAVVLLAAAAVLMSFLVVAVFATVVVHLYLGIQHLDGMPTRRWQTAARTAATPRWLVVALLVALAAASAAVADNRLDSIHLGRNVEVTAHRGSSLHAPENTLSALYQAMSDGADFAEIDVQQTADGTVVLLHDSDLMRIANIPAKIWKAQFNDLRQVDAGRWFSPEFAGEQIPTLQEALLAAADRINLNIELKFNGHERDLAERVVEQVRAAGCIERCVITSLDQSGLRRVRELAPEIRIGQIVTVAVGDATKLDVDILSMNLEKITPAQVRANRRAGLETHVWTVNAEDDMARMLDYGVDNIITDQPARLRAMIEARARLSNAELLLLALGRELRG